MRKYLRIGLALVGSLVVLLLLILVLTPADPQAKAPFRVSQKTTYITEPVDAAGYVDYPAALDQLMAPGVTPESNSVALLVHHLHLPALEGLHRSSFFRRLGIDPPPADQTYFQEWADFAATYRREAMDRTRAEGSRNIPGSAAQIRLDLDDELIQALEAPWKGEQLPHIAGWLQRNEPALDAAVDTSARPDFYVPIVIHGEGPPLLIQTLLPVETHLRDVCRGLVLRAMWRAGEGDIDGAWSDLDSSHRWAKLTTQGPFLISSLVGYAIRHMSLKGELGIAQADQLSPEQIRQRLIALRDLPALRPCSATLQKGERMSMLDCITNMARYGPDVMDIASGNDQSAAESIVQGATRSLLRHAVNWNEILEQSNQWYDRFAEDLSAPTFRERHRRSSQTMAAIETYLADSQSRSVLQDLMAGRGAITKRMNGIFMSLLLPALSSVTAAEQRMLEAQQLTRVAYALALVRAERGEFPESLEAARPYLEHQLPEDGFGQGGPHIYRRTEDGFLLYSVGENGKDDAGVSQDQLDEVVRWGKAAAEQPDAADAPE
jgi:hypothetical protein